MVDGQWAVGGLGPATPLQKLCKADNVRVCCVALPGVLQATALTRSLDSANTGASGRGGVGWLTGWLAMCFIL